MLSLRILEILFPIFAIAAAGWAYGRWKRPDMRFANQLNMDVFVPALIFHVLSGKSFDLSTFGPLALATLLLVLGCGLLTLPVAALVRIQRRTLVPTMMFKNVGNMGLPLAVFAFGEQALPAAVTVFLVSNLLHFTLGAWLMDHRAGLLVVFRIPMIQATVAGVAFSLSGASLPKALELPIEMLGQISIPLLLFALGVRLVDIDLKDWRTGLFGALLSPALGLPLAWALLEMFSLPPLQATQIWLLGALPPAVLNFIVAENYRQEPGRVASIVMLGNLSTVVTLPVVLAFVL